MYICRPTGEIALRAEAKGERRGRGKAQNGREAAEFETDDRDLARDMGVNEATVRTRLRRLEEANMLRVVAMRDLSAMGFEYLAPVGVQVKGRAATAVGEELAKIELVITVNVAIGTHDLEIQVVSSTLAEMEELLTNVIAKIDGVERLFPSLALKVLKYNPEWAPL